MSNTDTLATRRSRSQRAKSVTLSLDEQVQDFLDARDGLRIYDALYGNLGDKLLPRRLATGKSKRA
ncbi:MAG: hypothetical protein KGJ66_05430 [Alphaproteobacteria bacterium]|nr:hypothetical protein [Alphaproteobacteria bacterium]